MSRFDNFNTSDRAALEQMSTEDLREILRQSAQPESETDENTILIAMEILEKREATETPEEVAAAWEQFEQEHLAPTEPERFEEIRTPKPKKHKSFAKIAGIAAAVALAIFAAGTLITPVEGTNLWTVIVNWTKETLGIGSTVTEWNDKEIPEQLVDLSEKMNEYKLDVPYLLPTYVPEGYQTTATIVDERDDAIVVICQMENGSDAIAIQYSLLKEEVDGSQIQKNEDNPEIYLAADGTPVYIIQNMDVYNAIWTKGDIEIMILNIPVKEELIKMIDSIRGDTK